MAWVWKAPKMNASSGYALREDAVRAAVAYGRSPNRQKVAVKENMDPAQLETLWASLKCAGWAVYQVDI